MEQVIAVLIVENGWCNYYIGKTMKITLNCNNIRWNKMMMTPQQQLPTIIMDKSNPITMRKELIIITITNSTMTPTPRHIVTSNEDCKE